PKTSGLLPCTSAPDKGGSNVAAKAPIAEKITKPAAAEARRKRQALLSDGPGALMAHPRPASWQWPWNSANAQATASPPHNWAQASRLFPPPPAPARVSSGPNRFSPEETRAGAGGGGKSREACAQLCGGEAVA